MPGDFRQARVQGTDLPADERVATRIPQFVEVAQVGMLDQVLGVPEQIDDRHHTDAIAGGTEHQLAQFLVSIGVAASDARQTGVVHRIFQVQIKLLIAPRSITRQQLFQEVWPLDLPGEVPLEGANHGRRFAPARGGLNRVSAR